MLRAREIALAGFGLLLFSTTSSLAQVGGQCVPAVANPDMYRNCRIAMTRNGEVCRCAINPAATRPIIQGLQGDRTGAFTGPGTGVGVVNPPAGPIAGVPPVGGGTFPPIGDGTTPPVDDGTTPPVRDVPTPPSAGHTADAKPGYGFGSPHDHYGPPGRGFEKEDGPHGLDSPETGKPDRGETSAGSAGEAASGKAGGNRS